ncbi:MAG: hypothetical protein JWN14_3817 [Chthonomonadales bacterium]|nr:hypothetical protein [Chthonomonadales bacterium]
MFRSISEPDWKLFRRLQPLCLDRFCQRVLAEIDHITADTEKTHHERYLDIFQLIKQRDKELEYAFDAPRRSTALQQLAYIYAHDLLTPEEMAGFSVETRDAVRMMAGFWQSE